jgi:mannose-1-phosphate guanylyltransferase
VRAVVLVGGFGTRLRPLTYAVPKPLLPVGHVPIVEQVIANLARGGVTEAVLALGFKPEPFTQAYPDGVCAGVQLHYAVEPEPLDTAGAIAFAARHAGIDDTFVVANGDVLTDLDVADLVAFHRARGGEGAIHLTPVDDPSAFGVVPTDEHGRVTAFIEKPPRDEAPTNLINAGTYVLEPSVIERIHPAGSGALGKVSIERVTFPAMVADRSLYAMGTDDYWIDTGRPELYLQANLDVLDGRRRHMKADGVHALATVTTASDVERSVVSVDAVVEGGASIVDSVLLAGVTVEAGAVVRGSILGPGTHVGAGARVEGVVTGADVVIAAGSVLRDVRIPEPE